MYASYVVLQKLYDLLWGQRLRWLVTTVTSNSFWVSLKWVNKYILPISNFLLVSHVFNALNAAATAKQTTTRMIPRFPRPALFLRIRNKFRAPLSPRPKRTTNATNGDTLFHRWPRQSSLSCRIICFAPHDMRGLQIVHPSGSHSFLDCEAVTGNRGRYVCPVGNQIYL